MFLGWHQCILGILEAGRGQALPQPGIKCKLPHCPAGDFDIKRDLASSRRGWEGLDQAVGAGPWWPQYGSLFRKRENMVKAAWGMSVGTMCPAP